MISSSQVTLSQSKAVSVFKTPPSTQTTTTSTTTETQHQQDQHHHEQEEQKQHLQLYNTDVKRT